MSGLFVFQYILLFLKIIAPVRYFNYINAIEYILEKIEPPRPIKILKCNIPVVLLYWRPKAYYLIYETPFWKLVHALTSLMILWSL